MRLAWQEKRDVWNSHISNAGMEQNRPTDATRIAEPPTDLTGPQLLAIMNHLAVMEATWHAGNSLAQTVFTCQYLLNPTRSCTQLSNMAANRMHFVLTTISMIWYLSHQDEQRHFCVGLTRICIFSLYLQYWDDRIEQQ